jgi:hypothetical protein
MRCDKDDSLFDLVLCRPVELINVLSEMSAIPDKRQRRVHANEGCRIAKNPTRREPVMAVAYSRYCAASEGVSETLNKTIDEFFSCAPWCAAYVNLDSCLFRQRH